MTSACVLERARKLQQGRQERVEPLPPAIVALNDEAARGIDRNRSPGVLAAFAAKANGLAQRLGVRKPLGMDGIERIGTRLVEGLVQCFE